MTWNVLCDHTCKNSWLPELMEAATCVLHCTTRETLQPCAKDRVLAYACLGMSVANPTVKMTQCWYIKLREIRNSIDKPQSCYKRPPHVVRIAKLDRRNEHPTHRKIKQRAPTHKRTNSDVTIFGVAPGSKGARGNKTHWAVPMHLCARPGNRARGLGHLYRRADCLSSPRPSIAQSRPRSARHRGTHCLL